MTLRPWLISAGLVLGAIVSWGAVPVVINQTGMVPVSGVSTLDFKFAIIEFDAPDQALATATVAGGAVTAVAVQAGGTGYLKAPTVTFSGGGGSGAKATATIGNGVVTAIHLTAGGKKYTTPPLVTLSAPTSPPVVTSLWSNDNTSTAGSEPTAAVTLQVVNKGYSAFLGYTGLPNMSALPPGVLLHMDARVRVWYRHGAAFQVVVPDAPLGTIPYAEQAGFADAAGTAQTAVTATTATSAASAQTAVTAATAQTVADGSITSAKLAPGSVTLDKLAPGSTDSSGALLASLSPNDATLQARGYSRVQTFAGHDWAAPVVSGGPAPRSRHTALWTGQNFIVWGGEVSGQLSGQGSIYAPSPGAWTALTNINAPAAREDHTAIWTGSAMIVWGGLTAAEPAGTATGAYYDTVHSAWAATGTAGAPAARTGHTAVWTGDRLIVWGGAGPNGALGDGGLYTPPAGGVPGSGSWAPLSATGASPAARKGHTAVWTGTRMIVWGGLGIDGDPLNTGASYDPATDAWTPLATAGAPAARFGHTAIWTGSKMLVWGGAESALTGQGQTFGTGAAYDSATNVWTPLASLGAPEARLRHAAVWTGTEMLVFSGQASGSDLLTAGAYNPVADTWRALPALPAGGARLAGVWSGQALLAFGLSGLLALDPSPTIYLYGRF